MLGLAPRLPITITLLIAIAITSVLLCCARFPSSGRPCCALFSSPRNFFPRGPLKPNWRAVRRFLDARAERAAGRAKDTRLAEQEDRYRVSRGEPGALCLYGVHCRCSCSLIVKEE